MSELKLAASQQLFAYWDALRGVRISLSTPPRSRSALPDVGTDAPQKKLSEKARY